MINTITVFLTILIVSCMIGFSIVTVVDKKISNVSINIPKHNIVVNIDDSVLKQSCDKKHKKKKVVIEGFDPNMDELDESDIKKVKRVHKRVRRRKKYPKVCGVEYDRNNLEKARASTVDLPCKIKYYNAEDYYKRIFTYPFVPFTMYEKWKPSNIHEYSNYVRNNENKKVIDDKSTKLKLPYAKNWNFIRK